MTICFTNQQNWKLVNFLIIFILERHFCAISIYIFKNKLSFMKKAVLHIITLMHYKARQVLRDLFCTNHGSAPEMTFVARATKIYVKYLKT